MSDYTNLSSVFIHTVYIHTVYKATMDRISTISHVCITSAAALVVRKEGRGLLKFCVTM